MGGCINLLRLASLAPPLVPPQRGGGKWLLSQKGMHPPSPLARCEGGECPTLSTQNPQTTNTQSLKSFSIPQILVHNHTPSFASLKIVRIMVQERNP